MLDDEAAHIGVQLLSRQLKLVISPKLLLTHLGQSCDLLLTLLHHLSFALGLHLTLSLIVWALTIYAILLSRRPVAYSVTLLSVQLALVYTLSLGALYLTVWAEDGLFDLARVCMLLLYLMLIIVE